MTLIECWHTAKHELILNELEVFDDGNERYWWKDSDSSIKALSQMAYLGRSALMKAHRHCTIMTSTNQKFKALLRQWEPAGEASSCGNASISISATSKPVHPVQLCIHQGSTAE